MRMDGEQVLVNGEPARLVNFRGFDPRDPSGLSISQNRHQTAQAGNTFRLLARYYDLLMEAGWAETSHWRYSHDFFSAGPMVPVSARLYYRSLRAYANELGDPFTWISDSPDHCEQGTSVVAPPAGLPFGMNVLGHLRSEKGVGEMVRSNLRVLEAARIPFVAVDFVDQGSANVEQARRHYLPIVHTRLTCSLSTPMYSLITARSILITCVSVLTSDTGRGSFRSSPMSGPRPSAAWTRSGPSAASLVTR